MIINRVLLSENLFQFLIAQLTYPVLTPRYSHLSKRTLVVDHVIDALLKGVLGDKAMHDKLGR